MPKGVPGPVISHSRAQAWETFRQRGAVGVITFTGIGANAATAWQRAAGNRLTPALTLADPALDAQRGSKLAISFNGLKAEEKLFAGAPERFAVLMAKADSGMPLPHFDLNVRIRSKVRTMSRPIVSENVVGILRGSDPSLRDEYVVMTAHLDHVGVGRAVNGDSIYNGAMDNASGSALLMEMARTLAPKREQLKRSIIFLAVTAEEKGLLGSRYYANHPTVPARAIVADLNTDMFLPLIPFRKLMVNGLEESDLADNARQAASEGGVEVITDPEPEENRFIRSDQYSFILRGIPALSFKVGFALGTPEHNTVREFRAKRYHFPSDDLEQPVDRQAAADFAKVYARIAELVANRETRPSWNSDSYFRRLALPRTASDREP
ncbi:MAG: M28 family peptidase, partial [Gemmatimonadaceae bacterium]